MINAIRLKIADFLNTVLIDFGVFRFDLWMFVHIISGGILGFIVDKPLYAFLLLVAWEIFEKVGIVLGTGWFRQEGFLGVAADIVFGMIGYFVVRLLK